MTEAQEGYKPYRVRMRGCLYEIIYDRKCTVYRVELNQRIKVTNEELAHKVRLKMKVREEEWVLAKAFRLIWAALKTPWLSRK